MSWGTEKLGSLFVPSGYNRGGSNDFPVLSITMHEGLVDQSAKFKKRIASRDTASYRVVYTNEMVVGFPIDEGVLGFQTKYPAAIVSPAYGIWKLTRPQETYIPYLEGYLRSGVARQMYASKMRGGVARRRTISKAEFLEIEIPFPPLDEQKRIAAVLDKADALRRQRQESLQLTEKLLQSVFIDMFGDPAINPMGFPEGKLGDLLVSANYGTSAKAGPDGKWPVLRMGNITYEGGWDFSSLKYMELDPKEERKYLVHNGEILFNRTNSKELVGKTAVYREPIPMAYAGYLIRCVVNDEADPEYIAAFLNSAHGKKKLRSMCKSIVGMANINAKELQAISLLKPPVHLQRKFGVIVKSIISVRQSIVDAGKYDDLLFSSIQQRAFRGELDLRKIVVDDNVAVYEEEEEPMPPSPMAELLPGRYKKQGSFNAPPDIEAQLIALESTLYYGVIDYLPWSPDFFKYRTLSKVLNAPFNFEEIWYEAAHDMPDATYEIVKDQVLEFLEQGVLEQRFDEGRKEIVFYPRA
jgi:type I restriction enzyme, S subunit